MTKDEAIHKALKVLNCLNNDRVYETAWVKGAINACEEALEQPAQECKWCKSREVNFDDEPEPEDPLCKICGKGLSSTKECAWTGCPLNWGHEETKNE